MYPFSERKWKWKLKEWHFEKHLRTKDMKIVVAKVERRKREAGKDTAVFHNGVRMPTEQIENFKRRRTVRESDPASPSARGIMFAFIEISANARDSHTGTYHIFYPTLRCYR